MACPNHDSPEPITSNVPEDHLDTYMQCLQLSHQAYQQGSKCPDLHHHRLVAADDNSQQTPEAVHWSTYNQEYEEPDDSAEGDSTEACRAFDASSDSQASGTPSSSSDNLSEAYSPSYRDLETYASDMFADSRDGSTAGASSILGYTPSDAICERFLACDGPWSTYNRRVETQTYDYGDPLGPAVYDNDDDRRKAASCAE